jgi:hypothetical protein
VIADALAFLSHARHDERLVAEIGALGDGVRWEDLAALATRAGWRVSAAELERAHALDWGMRWARYHGPERP